MKYLFSIKNQFQKVTFQLFCLFIFTTSFCVFSIEAQIKKSSTKIFDSCETGKLSLYTAGDDFQKEAKPDSYLVIIGGAMKGEKSSHNNQRIQQATRFLNAIFKLGDRIVFGVGKTEGEYGYLRFYVNGVLRQEIITTKNARLCWGDGGDI